MVGAAAAGFSHRHSSAKLNGTRPIVGVGTLVKHEYDCPARSWNLVPVNQTKILGTMPITTTMNWGFCPCAVCHIQVRVRSGRRARW